MKDDAILHRHRDDARDHRHPLGHIDHAHHRPRETGPAVVVAVVPESGPVYPLAYPEHLRPDSVEVE